MLLQKDAGVVWPEEEIDQQRGDDAEQDHVAAVQADLVDVALVALHRRDERDDRMRDCKDGADALRVVKLLLKPCQSQERARARRDLP